MTCPDLEGALAWRRRHDEDPASWPAVRDHLRACEPCRRRAGELDPTVLFAGARRWDASQEDVAGVLAAARSWKRLRELEARGAGRGLRRAGAAAAVLACVVVAGWGWNRSETDTAAPSAAASPAVGRAAPARVDDLDREGARVYRWGSDEVDVVMVVDESLDV